MYYNIWNALYFAANFYRTEIISLLLKETSINVNEQTIIDGLLYILVLKSELAWKAAWKLKNIVGIKLETSHWMLQEVMEMNKLLNY